MEATLLTDIPKTQNSINKGGVWYNIPMDYYYDQDSFIGAKLHITYSKSEIISATLFRSGVNLDKIIKKVVNDKRMELREHVHSIEVHFTYEVIRFIDELTVMVTITKVENSD